MTRAETVTRKTCRVCGAQYTGTSPASQLHTASTGHNDWKRKRITREVASPISYQPGYGPTAVAE